MKRRKFIQAGLLSTVAGGLIFPASQTLGNNMQRMVKENERDIPVIDEADVIVCGAGPAGIAAAIEAGRSGAKTWLFEVGGALGGVWTSGLLSWVLDNANKGGIMKEIINKMEAMGGRCNIDTGANFAFDVEKMKLLLEELNTDAGVNIQLHTRVVSVIKDNKNRITHVITESKSGRQAWKGKVFIDTTGDGDVAALAGCSFSFGNENGEFQPMSLLALVTGVNFKEIEPFIRWQGDTNQKSKNLLLQQIEKGGMHPSYRKPGLYPIRDNLFMLMANHEYYFKGIDALQVTKATIQARRELHRIINSLQSTGGPWKDIQLIATADQIGVREGRRIHGLYTVTTQDIIEGKKHADGVTTVTFGVDVHSVNKEAEGINSKKLTRSYNMGIKSKDYDIPLRSLIAKDVGGLMMAGRCISGDFISHSSYRVTGNAVAMGEAVGKVAAQAAKQNKLPQEVTWKS